MLGLDEQTLAVVEKTGGGETRYEEIRTGDLIVYVDGVVKRRGIVRGVDIGYRPDGAVLSGFMVRPVWSDDEMLVWVQAANFVCKA